MPRPRSVDRQSREEDELNWHAQFMGVGVRTWACDERSRVTAPTSATPWGPRPAWAASGKGDILHLDCLDDWVTNWILPEDDEQSSNRAHVSKALRRHVPHDKDKGSSRKPQSPRMWLDHRGNVRGQNREGHTCPGGGEAAGGRKRLPQASSGLFQRLPGVFHRLTTKGMDHNVRPLTARSPFVLSGFQSAPPGLPSSRIHI